MEIKLKDLAPIVGGAVEGDGEVPIRGVSGIREAQAGEITFLAGERYAPWLEQTQASAVLISEGIAPAGARLPRIRVKNADAAFTRVAALFAPKPPVMPPGVHPTAVVSPGARLGQGVSIGAHCVIEEGASIGDGTVLYPRVYVGHESRIGERGLVYPGVVIRERVAIGNNVILHSGAVIGCDGFGYAPVKGTLQKIPQTGVVQIDDDVEIGANVTVDRARFGRTWIQKGTKIDNLVQIAHNVVIGEHSCIVALTGIAGSARIGSHVTLAGQTGVVGHIEIGDGSMIGARSGVTKDVPPKSMLSGGPAIPHEKQLKLHVLYQKLPELYAKLKELTGKVERLEQAPAHPRQGG